MAPYSILSCNSNGAGSAARAAGGRAQYSEIGAYHAACQIELHAHTAAVNRALLMCGLLEGGDGVPSTGAMGELSKGLKTSSAALCSEISSILPVRVDVKGYICSLIPQAGLRRDHCTGQVMDCSHLKASHLNVAVPASRRAETRSAWNLLVRGTLQADFPDVLTKADQQ